MPPDDGNERQKIISQGSMLDWVFQIRSLVRFQNPEIQSVDKERGLAVSQINYLGVPNSTL